jgi:GNAT superfamily N-acetyltransferase
VPPWLVLWAADAGSRRLAAATGGARRVRDLRRALLGHPFLLELLVLLLVLDARSLSRHAILLGMDEGTTEGTGIAIRLLAPGDEGVVRQLADYDGLGDPEGLLADPRTLLLVAFDGGSPVGFVLAHDLPRRWRDRSKLFVYEVDVVESHRRRGIGNALLARLAELARERGIRIGFVLTDDDNVPANALYRSAGGTSSKDVMWEFRYAGD